MEINLKTSSLQEKQNKNDNFKCFYQTNFEDWTPSSFNLSTPIFIFFLWMLSRFDLPSPFFPLCEAFPDYSCNYITHNWGCDCSGCNCELDKQVFLGFKEDFVWKRNAHSFKSKMAERRWVSVGGSEFLFVDVLCFWYGKPIDMAIACKQLYRVQWKKTINYIHDIGDPYGEFTLIDVFMVTSQGVLSQSNAWVDSIQAQVS